MFEQNRAGGFEEVASSQRTPRQVGAVHQVADPEQVPVHRHDHGVFPAVQSDRIGQRQVSSLHGTRGGLRLKYRSRRRKRLRSRRLHVRRCVIILLIRPVPSKSAVKLHK
ncbi:hypothetical protein AOXY_G27795 [Acipenser oxyrinchus oxyrinchus]|uniref:Uncharacterized protein n=1 Tax=Acipenser oxyrinchus oxyrinchus TaxID=40147 RepID=A0AAD8CDC8_ACIOX|nr:hypothetical protein AOXY_G38195 [Acipenser oxyrinchus oxyrinchus]KAK1154821.1 hypothetical protein AOXY_G27795 [Acipenser oxyrinchus oxyrinchus]